MTLSVRNNFFKGGITLAALSLGVIITAGYFAYSAFPGVTAAAAHRAWGVQILVSGFAASSSYVPFWTMLCAVACSFIGIALIYFFFEKTQSPEIFFFGFFIISLSFEFTRIAIPLKVVLPYPAMHLISAARVLLFGRYFGIFSLFAAGACAAGLNAQRQQTVFFMLVLAALIIALNVPVDSLTWDTSLKMLNGYSYMFNLVEAGILIITILTFFISAHTRGNRSYTVIGIGVLLAFFGRNILIGSDTWITPVPGFILLAAGSWFVCSRLHRIYLWL